MKQNLKLTTNFTLGEFFKSFGSWAWFLAQTPEKQQEILHNIYCLANRLQVIRDLVGVPLVITSGVRTPERNAQISIASQSKHLDGSGCDFAVESLAARTLLRTQLVKWSGGYAYYAGDKHFHIDIRNERARW